MKINLRHVLLLASASWALVACTTVNQQAQPAPATQAQANQAAPQAAVQPAPQQTVIVQPPPVPQTVVIRPQPIKMTATGNGSMGNYSGQNSGQQRLMAMRAAKIDAYRNLAEQVYGFQISGSTTLNAFAAQNDNVRAFVEAFMRGAKVVDMTASQDGIYEATVELELPADFRDCIVRGTCFPQPERAATGCAGPSCAPMAVVCSGAGCAAPSGSSSSSWWSSITGSK
jgi:hypothetical protein